MIDMLGVFMSKIRSHVKDQVKYQVDQVREIQSTIRRKWQGRLSRQVVDVRDRLEKMARDPNIEARVQSVLTSLRSQDFLQSPRVQELMSRVKERLSRTEEKSSESRSTDSNFSKVSKDSEAQENLNSPRMNRRRESFEHLLERRAPQLFNEVTSKLIRGIVKRAEEIQQSLQKAPSPKKKRKIIVKTTASSNPRGKKTSSVKASTKAEGKTKKAKSSEKRKTKSNLKSKVKSAKDSKGIAPS